MKLPTKDQIKWKIRFFMQDLRLLTAYRPNPQTKYVIALYALGSLCCLLFAGAIWGFKYGYGRLSQNKNFPSFHSQPSGVYVAMIFGALIGLAFPVALLVLVRYTADFFNLSSMVPVLLWLFVNFICCFSIMFFFRKWRSGVITMYEEENRHGSARFATNDDLWKLYLLPDDKKGGFYIGDYKYYKKSGHLLTVAGTRGGKGVNIIIPQLLKEMGAFKGSWVIIDPKGENAAVTARVMREQGRKVVILNPWDLLSLGGASFNPLDILKADRLNLSDDVQMIAEAIVPMTAAGDTDHFNNRARTVIAALLLHLVTARPKEEQTLATLWQWLRLDNESWLTLLNDMNENKSPAASEIVKAAANEIITLKNQSEREYGSVMSTAQKWTDFLKSPALRESLTPSGENPFNPADLTNELCVVYVVIPADRLKTHSQWLRLVVTSLMRSVIRQDQLAAVAPNEVCFMLDEAYALGYLSEIEIGLGSFAGYGVHIWAIYQNLVQISDAYGNNWENFISSCGVRHFFNISDVTTAEYVSKMLGQYSVPSYDVLGNVTGSSARNLVNSDELRQRSNDFIYTIIDDLPPAMLQKRPYYLENHLTLGVDYDKNPYIRD